MHAFGWWSTAGATIRSSARVAEAKKLSILDSARLFALAAVAREDALIAVFDAKYALRILASGHSHP